MTGDEGIVLLCLLEQSGMRKGIATGKQVRVERRDQTFSLVGYGDCHATCVLCQGVLHRSSGELQRPERGNPLGGRKGFGGESKGYSSSRVNLSSLEGKSVRFRFRVGNDSSGADYGWWVDDVRVYTCS